MTLVVIGGETLGGLVMERNYDPWYFFEYLEKNTPFDYKKIREVFQDCQRYEQENARLRDALEQISSGIGQDMLGDRSLERSELVDIAREALKKC